MKHRDDDKYRQDRFLLNHMEETILISTNCYVSQIPPF